MIEKHLLMIFHWSLVKKQLVCNFSEDSFKFLDSQWQNLPLYDLSIPLKYI